MRRRAYLAAVIFLGTMATYSAGSGCFSYSDQDPLEGGSGSSGTAGGPPDPPPQCVPGEGEGWEADALCGGIFVRIDGDDENAGTPDAPVKSLGKAIALASALPDATKRNVYACAETFEEKVEIQADVTLFGGLECENGWRWIGKQKRTTLTAKPRVIPLTMHGGGSVRMEDFDIVASPISENDPVPEDEPAIPRTSSIAAVADGVTASFTRCKIEASDAAPGANPRQDTNNAKSGPDGNPGLDACMTAVTAGGAEQYNECEDGVEDSIGGGGGVGQTSSGAPGSRGTPGGSDNAGVGQTSAGDVCTDGRDGAPGEPGEPGAGAGTTELGTLSRDGYTGVPGLPGLSGVTAQGGGGGGGARGVPNIANPGRSCPGGVKGVGGASGGSGGAGGCGGKGGLGGGAGGASIALISLYSTLEFHSVTLKTGIGGKGGDGAPGQRGGDGGGGGVGGKGEQLAGTSDLNDACRGGRGGGGGQGGRGGGGRGGHSIGIAFFGTPPPMDANEPLFELGDAGLGGKSDGNDAMHDGAPGESEPTRDFASP